MTRVLLFAAALALLPISASAQGFLPIDGEEDCMGCPPTMSASDGLTGAAETVGETMKEMSDDDAGYAFVWWLATNFSPHIPVDPKCPPPDGCTPEEDPEDPEDPQDPDGPGGEEGTPPGGGGEATPGGDGPPDDGDEEPQKSTSSSSSSSSSSASSSGSTPVETFEVGDRAAALDLRRQFESVPDGSYALKGTLDGSARLRLVSKREASADEGEFAMRFEVLPPGSRGRAVPVLVQAVNGKLYARTAAPVTSMPGLRDRVRSDRPRRRSVRG